MDGRAGLSIARAKIVLRTKTVWHWMDVWMDGCVDGKMDGW